MLHMGTVHSVSWGKKKKHSLLDFKRDNWGFIVMDDVSTWLFQVPLLLCVADDNCTYVCSSYTNIT